MKNVKLIAGILHFLSKVIALLYLCTAVYALLVILISRFRETSLFAASEGGFTIMYPFTQTPFLLGDNTSLFLVMMIVIFSGYGVFAWMLGEVFRLFTLDKLFTRTAVKTLTAFYLLNLLVPGTVLLVNLFFTRDVKDLVAITVLHAVIGIFAWFMANIFKQGLALQDEQDHTL